MKKNPIQEIINNKIVAVVRAEEPAQAIETAKAIAEGGIKCLEISVARGRMIPVIAELRKNPELTVAAGGIIIAERAQAAIANGAHVIVSPVFQLSLLKYCLGNRTPHIATVSTPNEAYNAWKCRIPLIKIFPAKSMGGVDYIEDMLTPMPFLHLMPSGGVGLDDFTDYLKAGAAAVGLGHCLYQGAESLKEITERAKFAVDTLSRAVN